MINTYGFKWLTLNLGLKRTFSWKFCIADVSNPILGADFLSHFGLLIDMKHKRLIDNVTGLTRFGRISAVNHFTICTTLSNSTYQKLLAEFPNLTRFTPISTVKNHGVEHHILTEGQPIKRRGSVATPSA
ncbi:hypothetical protein ALC62_10938 [Cyphomyrmex costatus]|uniref:Uncharacterized protein n=1 Tax=Cyphomyrmex costatus TaxID=456900 RepID=A0A151ID81_9HYME|nr:hypothetical protein ALC62_10938 [Cyphomyrmex costatus]